MALIRTRENFGTVGVSPTASTAGGPLGVLLKGKVRKRITFITIGHWTLTVTVTDRIFGRLLVFRGIEFSPAGPPFVDPLDTNSAPLIDAASLGAEILLDCPYDGSAFELKNFQIPDGGIEAGESESLYVMSTAVYNTTAGIVAGTFAQIGRRMTVLGNYTNRESALPAGKWR